MPSVLILEDDLIFLETLIDSFELIGFEVHGFSEIPPVLSIASQRPFDLFATDIRLENAKPSDIPGWKPYETIDPFSSSKQKMRVTQPDGIHCLQAIRKIRPKMPCIVVTGFAPSHSALRMLRLQVQGHLVKTFQLAELKKVTDTVLGETEQRSALAKLFAKTVSRFFPSEEEKIRTKRENCRANILSQRDQFYSEYYISIQSRMFSRNVSLTIWDQLCLLEKNWLLYNELTIEQAAQLFQAFQALLLKQRQFLERSTSFERGAEGQTKRPDGAHPDRATVYRIFQQVEEGAISTQEFSYAYWISTLNPQSLEEEEKEKALKLYRKLNLAAPSAGSLSQPKQSFGL